MLVQVEELGRMALWQAAQNASLYDHLEHRWTESHPYWQRLPESF
jgi:hypothetical protein